MYLEIDDDEEDGFFGSMNTYIFRYLLLSHFLLSHKSQQRNKIQNYEDVVLVQFSSFAGSEMFDVYIPYRQIEQNVHGFPFSL